MMPSVQPTKTRLSRQNEANIMETTIVSKVSDRLPQPLVGQIDGDLRSSGQRPVRKAAPFLSLIDPAVLRSQLAAPARCCCAVTDDRDGAL
jgi:hypothetical protein